MTEYFQRRFSCASCLSPWLWWTGLFLLLLGPTSAVLGQNYSPGQYFSTMTDSIADAEEAQAGPLYSDVFTGRSGRAFGAQFRAGYLTGPAVGRQAGIAPIELMPYFFIDKGMFFGDLRGFRNDKGHYGANLGGGYRHYFEGIDRIFGFNAYWTYDKTSGELFRQWGFGVETLGEFFDMRANAYFPHGDRTKLLGTSLISGSQRFDGYNLLYDISQTFGTTLRGADAEIGAPIAIPFARRHDLRIFAGGYWFDSDNTDAFGGWQGRLQAYPIPSLRLDLKVTSDRVFDTNVIFAVNWSYGGYRQPEEERQTQFNRMTTPVERQYNIVVARTDVAVRGLVAINPATNEPYFFEHVASYAPAGGDGTFENPWQTIDQANTAIITLDNNRSNDIVFVHADSVYTGDLDNNGVPDNVVQLLEGIRYLGDGAGVSHTVNVTGIGLIPLPSGTTGVARPQFLYGIGDGVTLANNAEFSGFVFGDPADPTTGPTGNGVFGTGGVHDVILNQDDFNHAGLNGMLFDNAGGGITSSNTRIFNPQGAAALNVFNGTPGIFFGGNGLPNDGDITSTGNLALWVHNVDAGGSVNLTGADILNTAGEGIRINDVAGNVTVDQATINDSTTTGILLIDDSGSFTFRGDIDISNPADDAINITNLAAGGTATFTSLGSVGISQRNAVGINLINDSGVVQFFGDVAMGQGFAGAAPGINWQDSSGSVRFNNFSITGSGADAIDLGVNGANSGVFRVTGNPIVNGLITGVGLNIQNNQPLSQVVFNNGISIASRGLQGILVLNDSGNVQLGGTTNIDNPFLSIFPAVDVESNFGAVQFTNLTVNNATGGTVTLPTATPPNNTFNFDEYGAGVNVMDNPGSFIVQGQLNVTSTDGIALWSSNAGLQLIPSGGIRVSDGNLTTAGAPAIDVSDSVATVKLTSVTDTGSNREGIRWVDNVGAGGLFDLQITGTTGGLGTGGTISGATLDGVFVDNSALTTTGTDVETTYVGNVSLDNMVLTGNLSGIHTIQINQLEVLNGQILNNNEYGVHARDTAFVDIQGTEFSGNGGADPQFNEIFIEVATADNATITDDDYLFQIINNIVTEQGADAVLITNLNSAAGAHASMTIERSTFTTSAAFLAGNTVNWNGTITDALIDFNLYNLIGGADIGVNFITTSPLAADTAQLRILTNDFEGAVGGNTAISINTAGQSTITIGTLQGQPTGNIINFNGTPQVDANGFIFLDTGIEFVNLGQNSNVTIQDTVGTINSDGATAILFTSIRAPGFIEISNNQFDITGVNGFFIERGVIFNSVVGGQVNVNSTQNNIINFNNTNIFTIFAAPNGVLNGQITINGTNYP